MNKLLKLWKKYSFLVLFLFLIGGLFDLRIALGALICMIAPMIVALFKGRFWCGNLCPRGSFYDNIMSRFSRKRKVPAFFRNYIFRLLIFALMMTVVITGMKSNWGNLYGIGMVFYRLIVITTLVGIVLTFFFNERSWCNFCPMGTMASLITRMRKSPNTIKVASSCVSCKLCEKNCPMGVKPYDYKDGSIQNPDCIQCGRCVKVCNKDSVTSEV